MSEAGREAPIGVFDSGVGGLTVVAALQRLLPRESILYLGDTARLPYGTKSPQTVLAYSRKNVGFLVERGVKAIVVACNTASAVTSGAIEPPVPLWGVLQPGARRAAQLTRGRIGVIATESTIASDAYGKELRRLRPELEVVSQACPLFVPLVEEGWHDDPVARGTRLYRQADGGGEWRDLGLVTSWAYSFELDTGLVLAYVKRRHQAPGTVFRIGDGPAEATVVALPVRSDAVAVTGEFE